MAGDVNLYFNDEDNRRTAEIEIMIAGIALYSSSLFIYILNFGWDGSKWNRPSPCTVNMFLYTGESQTSILRQGNGIFLLVLWTRQCTQGLHIKHGLNCCRIMSSGPDDLLTPLVHGHWVSSDQNVISYCCISEEVCRQRGMGREATLSMMNYGEYCISVL